MLPTTTPEDSTPTDQAMQRVANTRLPLEGYLGPHSIVSERPSLNMLGRLVSGSFEVQPGLVLSESGLLAVHSRPSLTVFEI
ncbi:hypothetical protein CY34DRAFT_812760 [Suillus luteus UH-Slu-Lm8-n1]|uniref:Unplaced genomic scaffold CY34scaffold_585, whole genome shotgun sequence n=1 Tax=Suillus luteus UH-Slu-Lm8-n1 TaxID=930992 RepID=A0A0C9ZYX6_9AGAM|nr:hypothetical protein CY34DRAFT_812760 [Suillus luteus UH-Slu-Lm8-n1]